MCEINPLEVISIQEIINKTWGKVGLRVHPFLVEWYNSQVKSAFKLNHDDNTLAFCVISLPQMFENGFIPYLLSEKFSKSDNQLITLRDPLDQFISQHVSDVQMLFSRYRISVICDFETHQNRRPKILVQTAGHVSGAAYYYQKSDVENPPWKDSQKIFGVSIHPEYGGWFAFRGVLIFTNVHCSDLKMKLPKDILHTDAQKIKLLEEFNNQWQNWNYRDIIPVIQRYSENQKQYFDTKPAERSKLLLSLICDSRVT